jgi:hypothetical protein
LAVSKDLGTLITIALFKLFPFLFLFIKMTDYYFYKFHQNKRKYSIFDHRTVATIVR